MNKEILKAKRSRRVKRQKILDDEFFRTKYIYINREYRYILVWFRKSDIPTKFHPILYIYSSHTEYVKRESIIFPLFLYALLNIKHRLTQKKLSEKELRHFEFYHTGTIMFTVLAWYLLLFP